MAISKVMFLAGIAICAFSLQGCGEGDTGGDNKPEYKAAAASEVATEEAATDETKTEKDDTPAEDVQEASGCPMFQAAVKVPTAAKELMARIVKNLKTDADCVKDVKGVACKEVIKQVTSDEVLFTIEKDHGFVAWAEKAENKAIWDKVKVGPVNEQLLAVFDAPVVAMQGHMPADATIASLTVSSDASTEAPSWLDTQLGQVIDSTIEAFCPAYEAQVAAAEKETKPFVEAESTKDKADAKAQVEAVKEENAVEASTTLAPDEATAAAESTPSTDAVMAAPATQVQAEAAASGTADADAGAGTTADATTVATGNAAATAADTKTRRLADIQV